MLSHSEGWKGEDTTRDGNERGHIASVVCVYGGSENGLEEGTEHSLSLSPSQYTPLRAKQSMRIEGGLVCGRECHLAPKRIRIEEEKEEMEGKSLNRAACYGEEGKR